MPRFALYLFPRCLCALAVFTLTRQAAAAPPKTIVDRQVAHGQSSQNKSPAGEPKASGQQSSNQRSSDQQSSDREAEKQLDTSSRLRGGDSSEAAEKIPGIAADPYLGVHGFDDLCQLAKQAASQPYAAMPALPQPLASWSYDDYLKVNFKPSRGTWLNQGLPFRLETFHRGFVQVDRVDLFTLVPPPGCDEQSNDVSGDAAENARVDMVCQRVRFSKDDFDYDASLRPDTLPAAGHAGLKIIGRFPHQPNPDEMLTFLGSSYFRGRSGDCVYGASARGLAIDIAMNKEEEFPDFRSFWVQMPSRDARSLTCFAHLDSPSVSGAYRFRAQPSERDLRIDVQAELYFRHAAEKVAIAPLTSMWMWGDGLEGPVKDLRPSVHDSDGLLIRSGKRDWTYRAFARQAYPSVTSIKPDRLRGFGLIQRNRSLLHYEDHNARYHDRPSVWITPATASGPANPDGPGDGVGDGSQNPDKDANTIWGDGTIELLELPGAHEGIDNLGAYWLPARKPVVGQAYRFRYCVQFFAGDPAEHNKLARVIDFSVKRPASEKWIDLAIKFNPSQSQKAKPVARDSDSPPSDRPEDPVPEHPVPKDPKQGEAPGVEVATTLIRGDLLQSSVTTTDQGNFVTRIRVKPTEDAPVEISLQLKRGGEPLSETFRYLLPPQQPKFVYPAVYTRQE